MKYLLIAIVQGMIGVQTTIGEYDSKEACETAKIEYEKTLTTPQFALPRAVRACVPKP